MKLIWKLLRQHISMGQLSGFFLANLLGMVIILFAVQFYKDALPVFTHGDSFMKKEHIVVTKKISAPAGSFAGKGNTLSQDEIKERYLQKKKYDTGDNKPGAGKTACFLRLVVAIVLGVGVCISLLSFYLLMLSIYLLLQKNTDKVENLLLIGYSPLQIGLPYQVLTVGLNMIVWIVAIILVIILRNFYTGTLSLLFPQWKIGSLLPALIVGVLLFCSVSLINILTIKKKIMAVWKQES
jgi:hypothetical protein